MCASSGDCVCSGGGDCVCVSCDCEFVQVVVIVYNYVMFHVVVIV